VLCDHRSSLPSAGFPRICLALSPTCLQYPSFHLLLHFKNTAGVDAAQHPWLECAGALAVGEAGTLCSHSHLLYSHQLTPWLHTEAGPDTTVDVYSRYVHDSTWPSPCLEGPHSKQSSHVGFCSVSAGAYRDPPGSTEHHCSAAPPFTSCSQNVCL
jgi:hypothetical protein